MISQVVGIYPSSYDAGMWHEVGLVWESCRNQASHTIIFPLFYASGNKCCWSPSYSTPEIQLLKLKMQIFSLLVSIKLTLNFFSSAGRVLVLRRHLHKTTFNTFDNLPSLVHKLQKWVFSFYFVWVTKMKLSFHLILLFTHE